MPLLPLLFQKESDGSHAMAAEIERDLISQRTTEALQVRKQQGMPLGRPKGVGKSKLDAYQVEITALLLLAHRQGMVDQDYITRPFKNGCWFCQ